jgi:hypothetical protein
MAGCIKRHAAVKSAAGAPFPLTLLPSGLARAYSANESGAILGGRWKLVIKGSTGTADAEALPAKRRAKELRADELVELFNLAEDPYETEDLADRHPDRVRELRTACDAFARQAVLPKTRPRSPGFQSSRVWGEGQ